MAGPTKPMRIHLIGVAGSGMSGLASLFIGLGHQVSGSDRVSSAETERLQGVGLEFSSPHAAAAVRDADLVIYSSAIKPGNAAYDEAKSLGIPMLLRAEALAAILNSQRGIVVAGTHGKTTTSSLATHVLRAGGLRPSHYVGAEIPVLGTNAHWSTEGDLMVAEGDESDGTLVNYLPALAILLNVEAEHLDHYTDGLAGIERVFAQFLDQVAERIIYCAEDPGATRLCAGRDKAISYGWDPGHGVSGEILESRKASTSFALRRNGEVLGKVTLGIPGRHNVLNALGACALALELGVSFETIAESMRTFRGARRRFEVRYSSGDYTVVDDYGHHPSEIRATVETALGLQPERLIGVFQPHRYTRTQLLAEEFGSAFAGVDALFVTDVYPASEAPIPGISGQTIVDQVKANGVEEVFYVPDERKLHLAVGTYLRRGDTILTLGAGNIHETGAILSRDLETLDKLRAAIKDAETDCRLYEPMRRHTTMKVGGPCQFWVKPTTVESFARAVKFFREAGISIRVIGRGSNLLIRDGGIPGAVIRPSGGEFEDVRVSGEGRLSAGVGARFKKVTAVAKSAGIGGFEWMEGIPGNVGGGLRMNAGAMGTQTFDQVVSVRYLDPAGDFVDKTAEEIVAHYRSVPELEENYAVSAIFQGTPTDAEEIASKIELSADKRRGSQPVAASAGCIFKNPRADMPAGKLVDELGFKGRGVGAAKVSDIHGNFIVNSGEATASDVLGLIEEIRAAARSAHGIELDTEVQIVGQDNPIN
ncbi:MAG: UDP-N-acetylmuramate--L-alanine ligase [Verrucomicrobiales bacterium]